MEITSLVSIIITTRNRDHLLPRAIESALNQTYKNIEIIVIDDCSNDNTKNIIYDFQKIDNRIKYIRNDIQSGANVSRNKAILSASGEFIAGLDDDDEFINNRIEILLKNYDSKFAFITSLNFINSNGNLSESKCPEIVDIQMILNFNILMNQALIEKKRLLEINLYDTNLKAYQDYDVWLRLMLRYGSVKVVQEYLQTVYFDTNRKRISTQKQSQFNGYFNWYKKHKKLFSIKQKKNHLSHFYKIRNKKISNLFFSILATPENIDTLNSLTQKYNKYKVIQELYKNINQLKNKDEYILYGFGSLGQYVFSVLESNVIGILDKNLNINFINNTPVIQINDLEKYYGKSIIITPIPYIDEIKEYIKEYNLNIIEIL
ncbi:glycosyltransferase [Aliarcobacter butzleri]|uniref:glycosyltransferase n=1 Tax=Aliarcobacter butzleri TaxID=28197 RepID=UPI0012F789FE|nr:glycosyltransferase [Aliarcobacter butzleri]